jgi:two-component system C4-dicarboxylate transport response regulator DctD
MITGHGDIALAVRCLKAGAYDFVEKPFEDDFLLASVARAVERSSLSREARDLRARLKSVQTGDEEGKFGMVGRSDAMRRLYQQIEMTARFDVPVLIVGETGSGKELTARAIHSLSRRSAGPFVPVNAGGLPDTMLESELFGHAKGAFTGADTDRDGKLVTASGGTLLLDEIESISPRAQVQLLRVLEDGLVHPLGKDTSRLVDIRLVATTKVDLAELVGRGALREDFYHRVVVATLDVPPLRDRREDIPLLAAHFLSLARQCPGISQCRGTLRHHRRRSRHGGGRCGGAPLPPHVNSRQQRTFAGCAGADRTRDDRTGLAGMRGGGCRGCQCAWRIASRFV